MVPCPTNIMEMLPDPYSAEIKVATVYAANINWATLPHTSWAMPGGFSIIHGQESSTSKRQRYLPVIVADKNFLL